MSQRSLYSLAFQMSCSTKYTIRVVLDPRYSKSAIIQANCAVSSFLLRFGQSAVRFWIMIINIDLPLQCCSDYVECFTDVHQHSFESIDFFPWLQRSPMSGIVDNHKFCRVYMNLPKYKQIIKMKTPVGGFPPPYFLRSPLFLETTT